MTRSVQVVVFLLGVVFVTMGLPGQALAQGVVPEEAGSRMGPPPALPVIVEPEPLLPGRRFERRAWQLTLDGSVRRAVCLWSDCVAGGGYAAGGTLLSRATPHFSWGVRVGAEHTAHTVDFGPQGREEWTTTAQSAEFVARLWFASLGRFDPYVQVAPGLGRLRLSDVWRDGAGNVERASSNSLVPSYAVSVGVDLALSDSLRFGTSLGWSQWLLSPAQRCPAALGICTQGYPGIFDLGNANWNAAASVSVVWGDPL